MQNQLFGEVPEKDRKRYISDNADRVEEMEYLKPFGPDDLSEMKDKLSTVSININDVEEEKKEATAGYAATLKVLNTQKKDLLKGLRNKAELVSEQCYAFFDHDAKLVAYYNASGQLVSSRTMRPGEYQKTTFEVIRGTENRTGTND